jgi:lysophospholipase
LSTPCSNPKKFVLFFNGRTEWIEKYGDLSQDFALKDDTAFMTFDHRGQGASTGRRSYIKSYDEYIFDIKSILDKVVGESKEEISYSIVAHSMGALIALYGIAKEVFKPTNLVLTSPLLKLPNSPLPRIIYVNLARFMCICGLSKIPSAPTSSMIPKFEKNVLTHDKKMFDIIANTPYNVGAPTFKWIKETYKATKFVNSAGNIEKLKDIPTLILKADQENAVDPNGIDDLVSKIKLNFSCNIKIELILKCKHEILAESSETREKALSLINNFL